MKKYYLPISLLSLLLTGCVSVEGVTTSILIQVEDEIVIHPELVEEYFNQEKFDYFDLSPYVDARSDQGDNLPIDILYNIESSTKENINYHIFIKEDQKIIADDYVLESSTYNFTNYKLDQKYTFNVEILNGKEIIDSLELEFITPKGHVRTISVDGVNNFRDLGSYGHIKQGLIYRSAALENNTVFKPAKSITTQGMEAFEDLGIKSEIDLRKLDERGMETSPIGGINYFSAPLYYGGNNILTYKNSEYDNPQTIKSIFDFLADENNYPVNFHCVRGTDRTGCLAYLIEGLLGVEEEFLKRDFIFSNFYNIGTSVKLESIENENNPTSTARYVNVIKMSEGDNLSSKIYNYLSSEKIGVSTENLDKIINILKA